MQETFKRKTIRIGNSLGLTIKKSLVKDGKIVQGQEYKITISDEAEQP